ncbi:MAG: hypothetical protein HC896_06885, partial [Bacteroidales bacterium]|nr:hypothetical protein [Bacteroidales bacterium]
ESFGTEGGILAGQPTNVAEDPLKLWGLSSVGVDTANNIFISYCEEGSGIKSFKPNGELNWQVQSGCFVEAASFDPKYDGQRLVSKNEVYQMDYAKTGPGSEWELYQYHLDMANNPYDPRIEFEHATARIQRVDGEAILYFNGMHKQQPHFWTYDTNMLPTINYTHKKLVTWAYSSTVKETYGKPKMETFL